MSSCPTQAVIKTVLFFLHFLKKVHQIRCMYEFCFETMRTYRFGQISQKEGKRQVSKQILKVYDAAK